VLPGSSFKGAANILVFPNLDAANIAFQFAKVLADALPVGPLLIGPAKPAHILTPSVTARGIVNVTAAAVVEAQAGSVAEIAAVAEPGATPVSE
jgi:malate dehydrogenase (oxaloacetate-decarboxylating)(NADP+)